MLHTGIQWEWLPQELGFGSAMTCWRRPVATATTSRGVPHGSGPGSLRWVVERTNAWIHGFRWLLRIRWEIRDAVAAGLTLAHGSGVVEGHDGLITCNLAGPYSESI